MNDNKASVIIIAILAICATIITCSYFSYLGKKSSVQYNRYIKLNSGCVFDKQERQFLYRNGETITVSDSTQTK